MRKFQLAWRGEKGRYCGHCGYMLEPDLSARFEKLKTCPECGTDPVCFYGKPLSGTGETGRTAFPITVKGGLRKNVFLFLKIMFACLLLVPITILCWPIEHLACRSSCFLSGNGKVILIYQCGHTEAPFWYAPVNVDITYWSITVTEKDAFKPGEDKRIHHFPGDDREILQDKVMAFLPNAEPALIEAIMTSSQRRWEKLHNAHPAILNLPTTFEVVTAKPKARARIASQTAFNDDLNFDMTFLPKQK